MTKFIVAAALFLGVLLPAGHALANAISAIHAHQAAVKQLDL